MDIISSSLESIYLVEWDIIFKRHVVLSFMLVDDIFGLEEFVVSSTCLSIPTTMSKPSQQKVSRDLRLNRRVSLSVDTLCLENSPLLNIQMCESVL